MNTLLDALSNDSDLADIPTHLRPQAMQFLYKHRMCLCIVFKVIVKASFVFTFFQHASSIAGGIDSPGSIGEFILDSPSTAILSFLRLVGCAYFRKHSSAFELHNPDKLFILTEMDNYHKKNSMAKRGQ